jgi:hypothetical protein
MEKKILAFAAEPRAFATATTYLRGWPSFSKPRLVVADDSREYVVKGGQLRRAVCNEQIVARLGQLLDAPVGEPSFVVIPEELRSAEPELGHIAPGLAHALLFRRNHSDRAGIAHTDLPENRRRFASLAILYGWAFANDHQLIYPNDAPHLVLSVDHGHFFPGGPEWAAAGLAGAPGAAPDANLVTSARLSDGELKPVLVRLAAVAEDDVFRAVAAPPDEWGMTAADRVAAASFLLARRDHLCSTLGV